VEVTRTTTADAVAFSVTFVSDVNPNTNIASDILAPGTLHHLPLLQLNDHLMGATYDDVNSAVARDDGLTPTRYAATIVDHVAGASLQMADLRGLDTGVAYYVRVSAANDRGYGSYQVSNPPSLAPVAAPGSVAAVRLLPHTETSVVVEYDEIADENGADILSYKVEWAGASSFQTRDSHYGFAVKNITHLRQRVVTAAPAAPISGTFTLATGGFVGLFTVPVGGNTVKFDLTPGSSSLIRVEGATDLTQAVSRNDWISVDGTLFRVHATAEFTASKIPLASVDDPTQAAQYNGRLLRSQPVYISTTTLGSVIATQGDNQVQTQWNTAGATGTDFDVSGAVNLGDRVRIGHPITGPTYRIRTVAPGSVTLAPEDDPTVVHSATFDNAGGDMTFVPMFREETTDPIAFDATAFDVQSALESLEIVPVVHVSREVVGNGFAWDITFAAPTADGASKLYVNGLGLVGAGVPGDATVVAHGVGSHIVRGRVASAYVFARVAALNARGYGTPAISAPPSRLPQSTVPYAPTAVTMQPASDTELLVEWAPPTHDGGISVTEYEVEWDTSTAFNTGTGGRPLGSYFVAVSESAPTIDVQEFRTVASDDDLSGTFRLSFYGSFTEQLAHDATAADVEAALEALPAVSDVAVRRNVGVNGHTWVVSFTNTKVGGDLNGYFSVDGAGLRCAACGNDGPFISVSSSREVQAVYCDAGAAGTFKLSFRGHETVDISVAATAEDVEDAVEALPFIGDVDVSMSLANVCGAQDGVTSISFNTLHGDLAMMQVVGGAGAVRVGEAQKGASQRTVGRSPFSFVIPGLNDNTDYYVRVSAYNHIGHGAQTFASVRRPRANVALP
jgi:hypothetical protein